MSDGTKKQVERQYVDRFFAKRDEKVAVQEGEQPDFRIQRSDGSTISLEVTEYHPKAENHPVARRSEIETRWRRELAPMLREEQVKRPDLRDIVIQLHFSDTRLPKNREHASLVTEIIRLLDTLAKYAPHDQRLRHFQFMSRSAFREVGNLEREWAFLAKEDWPECARHLKWITAQRCPGVGLVPIGCPDLNTAWCGTSDGEVARILNSKSAKARSYNTEGMALWLLIVCNISCDLQSNAFPLDSDDHRDWLESVDRTGFDLAASPFAEVWLMSGLTGNSVRVAPRDETIAL